MEKQTKKCPICGSAMGENRRYNCWVCTRCRYVVYKEEKHLPKDHTKEIYYEESKSFLIKAIVLIACMIACSIISVSIALPLWAIIFITFADIALGIGYTICLVQAISHRNISEYHDDVVSKLTRTDENITLDIQRKVSALEYVIRDLRTQVETLKNKLDNASDTVEKD